MTTVDIKKLSLEELTRLCEEAKAELKRREDQAQRETIRQIRELAKKAGVSLKELAKTDQVERKKAAVKYRNPDDHTQTWSGRGKKPRWLVEMLDAGRELSEFLVA